MPNVIKFEGIDGECQISGYENWIDVGPYSLAASAAHSGLRGGGRSGGAMDFQSIAITKKVDSATSKLLTKMAGGDHFPKVEIVSLKTTGTKLEKYLSVELGKVFLTSYHWSNDGEGASNFPSETWTLEFKKIDYKYQPQEETGVLGAAGEFSIDLGEYKVA